MNITTLTNESLEKLKKFDGKIAVTAYIPTDPIQATDWGSRRAEFRTLLKTIKQDLTSMLDITQAEQLIDELGTCGEAVAKEQRHGSIALYSDGKTHLMYHIDLTIPLQISLDTVYDLQPLDDSLAPEQNFFVLSLSKSGAKLFTGNSQGLHSIDVPMIEEGYKEALRFDDGGKELQGHSSGKGEMFHGQDDIVDNQKKYLSDYFRLIDKAISGIVGRKNSPVVLAGVSYLADLYRHVSKSKHLAKNIVHGNVQHTSNADLWEQAFPLAQAMQA